MIAIDIVSSRLNNHRQFLRSVVHFIDDVILFLMSDEIS